MAYIFHAPFLSLSYHLGHLFTIFLLFFRHLYIIHEGVAIDRSGNAFAVGSGNIGNVARNSTVFYSPLSSAYATWSPISPPGTFHNETQCCDMNDCCVLILTMSDEGVTELIMVHIAKYVQHLRCVDALPCIDFR